ETPQPSETSQPSQPAQPSQTLPPVEVKPVIQNSSPDISVEVNNLAPANPAPQKPPVQVGAYVEKAPNNANLAVQLPRTGAVDGGGLSLLALALGLILRKLHQRLL
ncbi:MAG: hypothetical protein Q4D97_01485, partial [Eubacteriales bacterium]|nr:hypothetical protein [Eubacteriales bacterium]